MGQAPPSKAQRIHFEGRNCDGIDSKFKQRRYEISGARRPDASKDDPQRTSSIAGA